MIELLDRLRTALSERYAVEREIGRGGMATVLLAEDLKHHRQVAIKVLHPELGVAVGTDRFLREIETVAGLRHPHILPLHDSGEVDGLLYFVMPYVEGKSLRERLERDKQLPVEEAIRIAREVSDALDHAHRHGVVHRDIKPANILLDEGHAVVTDFGVARAVSEAGGEKVTATGLAVGTPAYMSPEQAAGQEADERSDIYALGCVLYEMLAGQAPLTGVTPQATQARRMTETPPPLHNVRASVPVPVDHVLGKALDPVPADRYATARLFADAVAQAAEAKEEVIAKPGYRRLVLAAVLAVVAIIAVWQILPRFTSSDSVRSIAVLPLENLMGDPEQEYFVQGMHDALISELAQLGGLDRVISRTSVMRYGETDKSVPEIARELNVDALVEGTVLRVGDSVRIQAQLIGAFPERHLWAATYDKDMRDVLALHSEVARAIAEQIQVTLTPEEAGRLASARTVDPAAYEDYLKGQYQWNKQNREGWEAAAGHFQQSNEKDPSFAPAYAMLSATYSLLGYYGSSSPPAVLYSRALAAAERAVALDNALAEAHASLALVFLSFDWDWAAADRASQEALRLNPNSPMALYSRALFLTWVGRHEEAIAVAKRAVELDPVAPHVNTGLGMHYFMARRYDEAIEQLKKVLALEPDRFDAHIWLRFSYAKKGMYEEAAPGPERGFATASWYEPWILALAGRSAEARELYEQIPDERSATPNAGYFLAIVSGELGEKDRAFALLEQAYQGRSPLMSVLKVDPRIDSLRDDARFENLLRRMNFPN